MNTTIINSFSTQLSENQSTMLAVDILYEPRVDIQKIDELPPMPAIANELFNILNDPDAEIEDIADIIVKDPGLTAKLLGLANSAFFSFGRSVNTITEAIINVLGLELVKGLSLGLIMSNSFDSNKCKGFDISQYWSNALYTANLTRNIGKLGEFEEEVNPAFFYLYGLLHNLGILVLADCYPEAMENVFSTKEKHPEEKLNLIEKEELGITHYEAGVFLTEKWGLPEDIITAIGQHANFDYRGSFHEVAQLTGYCSRMGQHALQESPIEDRNALIPNLINLPLDKCETLIEQAQLKIDDVKAIAAKMNN